MLTCQSCAPHSLSLRICAKDHLKHEFLSSPVIFVLFGGGWDGIGGEWGCCRRGGGHSPLLSNRWRLLLLLLQCLAWTVSMVTHPQEHVWPEKKVGLLGLWIMMRLCFFIFYYFFLFSPTQQTAMIQWRQLNCFIKQFCKWMFHTIITGGPNWAWGLEPVFINLVDWNSKVCDIPP